MDEVAEKAFHWATTLDKVIRSLKISEPETVEFVKEEFANIFGPPCNIVLHRQEI